MTFRKQNYIVSLSSVLCCVSTVPITSTIQRIVKLEIAKDLSFSVLPLLPPLLYSETILLFIFFYQTKLPLVTFPIRRFLTSRSLPTTMIINK